MRRDMLYRYFVLTLFVIVGTLNISCQNGERQPSPFEEIRVDEAGLLIVVFPSSGECVKCELATQSAIDHAKKLTAGRHIITTVACVQVRRDVERELYTRTHPGYDYYVAGDGETKSQLGVPETTRLIVMKGDQTVVGTLDDKTLFDNPVAAIAKIIRTAS